MSQARAYTAHCPLGTNVEITCFLQFFLPVSQAGMLIPSFQKPFIQDPRPDNSSRFQERLRNVQKNRSIPTGAATEIEKRLIVFYRVRQNGRRSLVEIYTQMDRHTDIQTGNNSTGTGELPSR